MTAAAADEGGASAPRPSRASEGSGWGYAQAPDAMKLADRLAAAVRSFEEWPSMNNRERMLEACAAYESTLR